MVKMGYMIAAIHDSDASVGIAVSTFSEKFT
jgi:hypothetical protein